MNSSKAVPPLLMRITELLEMELDPAYPRTYEALKVAFWTGLEELAQNPSASPYQRQQAQSILDEFGGEKNDHN